MAFNIDPSISLNVKGPQTLTLPDMLNLATGVQAYKQAQAVNPIIQDIYQSKSNLAKYDVLNSHFDNIIKNSSDLLLDKNLTKEKIIKRATDIDQKSPDGPNEKALNQILSTIPENATPTDLQAWVANMQLKAIDAKSRVERNYPAGSLPGQLPNVSYQGNQDQQQNVVQNPQDQNQPANVQPNVVQQNVPNQGVTQDQMNKPTFSQPEALQYPVRTATTVSPYSPTEKLDQDAGNKFRNDLVGRQSNLTSDRRSIDEVIKKAKEIEKNATFATSGALGSAERFTSQFLGTEQGARYKEIAKDLANVQQSNLLAQGGSMDSVEGLKIKRLANGDETYPPSVLINIANRTKATMTDLDLRATAAQKFAQKYGDSNMKSFQQMWSKNADSRIFELYNIFNDSDMTDQEKKAYRDKILPKDAKQRKIFQEKWNNIQKLESTGSL